MSETPVQVTIPNAAPADASTTTPAETEPAQDAEKSFSEAYVKGLRTEAANYRTRLKEFEQAEEARKQAEMTESQKLLARAEAAEKRAKELEITHLRTKAALKHHLPEDLHEFLTATDEEGAEKQAKVLATRLVPPPAAAEPPKAEPTPVLPGAGGRAPAHSDKPAGFTPEEQQAAAKRYASQF